MTEPRDEASAIAALAAAGLDLVQPFDPRGLFATGSRRALLVGNTRALWAPFSAAFDPRDPHPLDHYVERAVAEALPGAPAVFAHRRYGGAFVPFQRLAAAVGLGTLTPAHILVHPVYGPWIALRAVAIVDGPEPPTPVLVDVHGAHDDGVAAALAHALAVRGPDTWRAWLAVRDAIPVGRSHRYGEAQIRYHYTHAFEPAAAGDEISACESAGDSDRRIE